VNTGVFQEDRLMSVSGWHRYHKEASDSDRKSLLKNLPYGRFYPAEANFGHTRKKRKWSKKPYQSRQKRLIWQLLRKTCCGKQRNDNQNYGVSSSSSFSKTYLNYSKLGKYNQNMDDQEELLSKRYVDKIMPSKEALERLLESGKKLKIYIGVDPTGPRLHLGHSTNFLLLKKFQNLGHKIIFLVGDFTARIGDPTDKTAARQKLSKEEVLKNCEQYKEQAEKILNFSGSNPVEIRFNGQWLSALTFEDLIELSSNFTVQQMLERDMFQERLKEQKPIHLHEFFYPLMQGYDSVVLDVDLEVGGSDQLFNMLCGRTLMKILKSKEKIVLTTPLLINPATGKKLMNKSAGTYIAINDSTKEMFGKIMSLTDVSVMPVFEMCTEIPLQSIEEDKKSLQSNEVNPMDLKKKLAFEIVRMYHGEDQAQKAQEEFERVFQKREAPDENILVYEAKTERINVIDLLVESGLAPSRSEAKRLIEQNGVDIDNKVVDNVREEIRLQNGMIVKVGKRKFSKIMLK
ncbi:MAG: tyrosine--tRNA ligase, partial [bacterium]|nr:tyrosine--tRNA ligase [bacterium]